MKKKLLIVLSVAVILILALFSILCSFDLVKQSDCAQYQIDVPQDIKKCVATETIGLTELQTVDYCVDLTAELLDFSFVQDKLFSKPVCKAHCVTYAQLCSNCVISRLRATSLIGLLKGCVAMLRRME